MKRITLQPQPISKGLLEHLEDKGLIQMFRPTELTLNPPAGTNVGESLYESDEKYGPHKLIAVGINNHNVALGFHPDNEEFLLPYYDSSVKPVYLVISYLPEEEIRAKDRENSLSAKDFVCLSLYPAPRGAEMFTVLGGTVHCEVTKPGEGEIGCFFVTESRDLPVISVDLEKTMIDVEQ